MLSGKTGWYATMQRTFQTQPAVILSEIRLLITDTILLELTGTFALKNNSSSELEVIIETAEGKYQKDYVYLNDYTMYVVEDISGSDVDKYHYEINFLPQWGLKVTHNVKIDGGYAIKPDENGRLHYILDNGIDLMELDGICLFVSENTEPDYRIVAIKPYRFLTLEVERT